MALVSCGECGAQVSDKAAACPKCGAPPSSPKLEASVTNAPTKDAPAQSTPPKGEASAASALPKSEASAPSAPPPTAKPRRGNPSALAIVGVTLGTLAVVFALVYKFVLNSSARGIVAKSLGETAIGQHVIPWPDKADEQVKQLSRGQSGANLASSIVHIAHPTGESPSLKDISVRRLGDQLSVRIVANWRGGFLG